MIASAAAVVLIRIPLLRPCAANVPDWVCVTLENPMIVYHGTTIDCLEGIKAEGLRPGTYVAPNIALARDYAFDRAMTIGADGCVVFELDVPDASIEKVEAWWWTGEQLLLPLGCTPECILSVDDSDPRAFQAADV
jgi:hypothetical protein